MSQHFITNEKQLLSTVMDGVFPYADKLYFLVGFFYFSGFEEIYKNIGDKDLKILVGLDIEKDMVNRVKEVDLLTESNISRGLVRENFNTSLVQMFNETDFFDSNKKQEAFKIFLNKIKDGSLEIRKTLEPNHSKLYLFENKSELTQAGTFPGTLITGSSNLTSSGLRHQYELNVILRDKSDYDEGRRIFDELWDKAVIIADKNHIADFETEVVEKIWFEKLYKPYYIFLRVLHEYFSVEYNKTVKLPHEITKSKFINLKYQTDAIKQALATIENHNGVIVADVVGLGKSVIGSSIAHNIGLKTIVIAPPHLIKQWDDEYRDLFDFNAKVFSSGSIDKALEYYNYNYDGEEKLIIIDEAHKYRNEETQDYVNLHKLCQGNKVVLLTATPFNNKPQDVFSMVKLFQIPSKSTLKTVGNLGEAFTRLIKEYKDLAKAQKSKSKSKDQIKTDIDKIAKKIRDIIAPLVIRRSRLDLKEIEAYKNDIKEQGIEFSKINPPQILEYKLGSIEPLYVNTLELISSETGENCFKATRYKPVTYLKDPEKFKKKLEEVFGDINLFRESQNNIAKFMRHLLVRRFESSVFAFKSTLESMMYSSQNILNWCEKREKVPIYKKGNLPDIQDFYTTDNDDLTDELIDLNFEEALEKHKSKGLFEIPLSELRDEFISDIQQDIQLLKTIHTRWFENGIIADPKQDSFFEVVKDQLKKEPNRKIIVFSEFSDTVNYLYDSLKDKLRVIKYTSADASPANKEIIRKNFDAGLDTELQVNDYDVLLATDAISEGYNLHRAGTIFNYDIPFNPTRVIQRIGRINRINKKVFDTLNIYNYFPTETGEYETRTKEISTLKIAMIHALLGEDTQILTKEEELQSFYKKQYEEEIAIAEDRSWETPFLDYYFKLKDSNSEALQEAMKIPVRTRIKRTVEKQEKGILVFGKKGNDFVFRLGTSAIQEFPVSPETALSLFEASPTEKAQEISNEFESIYEFVKNNLFKKHTHTQSDDLKIEVIKKIKLVISSKAFDKIDYLQDLYSVVELDALPKHYLRYIKKLKVSDFNKLPEEITSRYLTTILTTASEVDSGVETLIISEELI